MKRSLKWFMRAWISLSSLVGVTSPFEKMEALDGHLERMKHAPEIDKTLLLRYLRPAVEEICGTVLGDDGQHDALAADILVRIAHVLLVLRLDPPRGRSRQAEDLLRWAARLDPNNLLVWSGLLRCELRGMDPVPGAPEAMQCWPSGASDVDQAIRVGEYLMLERLCVARRTQRSKRTADVEVARALLNHFHTHTDSINLRLGIHHRYLMKARSDRAIWEEEARFIGQTSDAYAVEFICLRRYGSFHPLMPRPVAVSAVGGGYLVRVYLPRPGSVADPGAGSAATEDAAAATEDVFSILIDPGQGVVDNLYRVGLGIADVDMIIATHDHPDHLAALDAILSLRHEHRNSQAHRYLIDPATQPIREPDSETLPTDGEARRRPPQRMLILGNRSVVNRYSFLNGDNDYVVQHIDDADAQRCPQLVEHELRIDALTTQHGDLGKDNAVGFVLTFVPLSATIAFMSDTAIEGVGTYKRCRVDPDDAWSAALDSDIVVAHISDAPSGELRELARFAPSKVLDGVDRFEASIARLLQERPEPALRLIQALSLTDDGEAERTFRLFGPGFLKTMQDWEHLYLHGLSAVSHEMASRDDGKKRVLVIGESASNSGRSAEQLHGR